MAAKKRASKTKKRSTAKAAAASADAPKKRGRPPEKAALIAKLIGENPTANADEIVSLAKAAGTTVSKGSVYTNSAWSSRRGSGSGGKKKGGATSSTANGSSRGTHAATGSAEQAKVDFTRSVQILGVARAKKLLTILASLERA